MNNVYRTQEESAKLIEKWAEQYCNLKFTHEMHMCNLKQSFKHDFDELHQELKEAFVSKQLIEYHRSQYDKRQKLKGIQNYQIAKTDKELPEILFASIMRSFSENTNSNNQFYKDTYLEAKELILRYYSRYFEMKKAIHELKEKQSKELNELVIEIKGDSVAFYMITSIYSAVRAELRNKDKSPSEYDFYTEIYNSVKNKILDSMEITRKETLIDYKADVEVQIQREEAIERIQYIQNQINSENYTVLREMWLYSEDRYFIIDVKDKANKIKRTLDYYNKYTSLELLDDEHIINLMNVSGIRLRKNHKYIKIKEIDKNF